MRTKNVYIIAGPNGAGKTTFAKMFLPKFIHCLNFLNADIIAKGLAPFDPDRAAVKAGRLLLEQIHEISSLGVDFSFETTLSGKIYANLFSELKKKGYPLHLFFLWLPNPKMSIARIKDRVLEGGHHVPADDVRRRFDRGLNNFFNLYETVFDSWMFFDNSEEHPVLIAEKLHGRIEILNEKLFVSIQKNARGGKWTK